MVTLQPDRTERGGGVASFFDETPTHLVNVTPPVRSNSQKDSLGAFAGFLLPFLCSHLTLFARQARHVPTNRIFVVAFHGHLTARSHRTGGLPPP